MGPTENGNKLKSGVPQDSFLGPCFSIYTLSTSFRPGSQLAVGVAGVVGFRDQRLKRPYVNA